MAVRRDQLSAALAELGSLKGQPLLLFLGNNPDGHAGIGDEGARDLSLGFPGIGGTMANGIARYVRIRPQPTALEAASDQRLAGIEATVRRRVFSVQRVSEDVPILGAAGVSRSEGALSLRLPIFSGTSGQGFRDRVVVLGKGMRRLRG